MAQPGGYATIGDGGFEGCSALTKVTISTSKPEQNAPEVGVVANRNSASTTYTLSKSSNTSRGIFEKPYNLYVKAYIAPESTVVMGTTTGTY